jgi:hypothetical protein
MAEIWKLHSNLKYNREAQSVSVIHAKLVLLFAREAGIRFSSHCEPANAGVATPDSRLKQQVAVVRGDIGFL